MGFWVRSIIFAIILIGLAVGFLANKDFLLSLDGSLGQEATTEPVKLKETTPKKAPTATTATSAKPQYQQGRKSANAAAEGLSNFYAKIYGDGIGNKGPKIRNNIIFLPEPLGSLVEILQAKEMKVRPYKANWQGTTASRAFRKGQTLYQKLAEYAEQDDLEIIWWLNKDFIIKDPFRINKNILKTAYQIGEAVSGHFPEGISSYFCYRQRTLVFINEAPEYLDKECTSLKPKNAY
ncbi:MAG: TcpQ domain-containing protein [Colwellia sp.]|nr:TcpQ domain-containing protein [Colwellia sp.]